MQLEQEFSEILTSTEIEGFYEQCVDCVKIADNYAIDFANWYIVKCILSSLDYHLTTKELLQMYKKEKGL